jgi:hypothetical protein
LLTEGALEHQIAGFRAGRRRQTTEKAHPAVMNSTLFLKCLIFDLNHSIYRLPIIDSFSYFYQCSIKEEKNSNMEKLLQNKYKKE